MLLATLNRLEGVDDPRRRAALIEKIADHPAARAVIDALPETAEQLQRLLSLCLPPPQPREPADEDDALVAMTFFLSQPDRDAVEAQLEAAGGERGEALVRLLKERGRD